MSESSTSLRPPPNQKTSHPLSTPLKNLPLPLIGLTHSLEWHLKYEAARGTAFPSLPSQNPLTVHPTRTVAERIAPSQRPLRFWPRLSESSHVLDKNLGSSGYFYAQCSELWALRMVCSRTSVEKKKKKKIWGPAPGNLGPRRSKNLHFKHYFRPILI